MQGKVLDFASMTGEGVLLGSDGKRYYFAELDWKSQGKPQGGAMVDFITDGDRAKMIYLVAAGATTNKKDKMAAGLLAIFLGGLGIHKFYLGFTGPGLVYLLTNTIGWAVTWALMGIPNIILGIMALIEGIIYLTQTDEDFERNYVINKKQWF
ncbi:MAG TPA: TM2 domain-containing protein [Firmicutes bacterium]|jgi:TM2 domain-containing membrane protein YozV|nr:TM2 domain-containing protein [Bacillota bacterium]